MRVPSSVEYKKRKRFDVGGRHEGVEGRVSGVAGDNAMATGESREVEAVKE